MFWRIVAKSWLEKVEEAPASAPPGNECAHSWKDDDFGEEAEAELVYDPPPLR